MKIELKMEKFLKVSVDEAKRKIERLTALDAKIESLDNANSRKTDKVREEREKLFEEMVEDMILKENDTFYVTEDKEYNELVEWYCEKYT